MPSINDNFKNLDDLAALIDASWTSCFRGNTTVASGPALGKAHVGPISNMSLATVGWHQRSQSPWVNPISPSSFVSRSVATAVCAPIK